MSFLGDKIMGIKNNQKKAILAKRGRRTKWAPFWAVLRKFGAGKRVHPSSITKHRRNWRRTKLHIKPRKQKKYHFG
jgi:ribosomal protein L39E